MSDQVIVKKGDRYNRLTVVKECDAARSSTGRNTYRQFLCLCDCGKETYVKLTKLRTGRTRSCGCLRSMASKGAPNTWSITSGVATTPIGNDLLLRVSEEDLHRVDSFKWVPHSAGYAVANIGRRLELIHRVILGIDGKNLDGDHINRDRLDNRRGNIRVATRSQNLSNKPKRKGCKSRFKGVIFVHKKITARITCNCVTKYLGSFKTEELAAMAYDRAAKKLHGDYAATNESLGYFNERP